MPTLAPLQAPAPVIVPDFPPERSDADIREHAAQILESRGWIKKHLRGDGGFCMMGAVHEAAGYPGSYQRVAPIRTALTAELGQSPEKFNDRPWRRKGAVTAALRGTQTA